MTAPARRPPAGEWVRWIRRFGPNAGGGTPLFCFPHAGGAASFYFPLAKLLAPRVEVFAVQYPGRQDRHREPCMDGIPALAECVAEVMRASGETRPYSFFGHSMGAVVAFEVARRLMTGGARGPRRLFVSGRRGPAVRGADNVHKRGDAALLAELRSIGGTDPRLLNDEETLATILSVARADYKAIETYQCPPGAVLNCPISALTGDADPQASIPDVSAWSRHTTAGFTVQVFPGGHFYLDAQRTAVAAAILQALPGAPDHGAPRPANGITNTRENRQRHHPTGAAS